MRSLSPRRGCKQSIEVVTARPARAQVRGDAGVALRGLDARQCQIDVDVQHRHRLCAAYVARVGLEEPLQLRAAAHPGSEPPRSIYPLAARTPRNSRLAPNSDV